MYIEKELLQYIYKKINQSYPKKENLSYREICDIQTLEIIKSLPKNKATVFKATVFNENYQKRSSCLLSRFNNYLQQLYKKQDFPRHLKYADITPVFKKGGTTDKSKCRSISTLSNFSKLYEKLIYSQGKSYMEPKRSKYLAGFCRNHNTQHPLLRKIES